MSYETIWYSYEFYMKPCGYSICIPFGCPMNSRDSPWGIPMNSLGLPMYAIGYSLWVAYETIWVAYECIWDFLWIH